MILKIYVLRMGSCFLVKQKTTPVEKEVSEKQTQTSSSWLGLLKYSLVLLIPGFLNHAALFREAEVLRPPGQYNFCGARKYPYLILKGEGGVLEILRKRGFLRAKIFKVKHKLKPEIQKLKGIGGGGWVSGFKPKNPPWDRQGYFLEHISF